MTGRNRSDPSIYILCFDDEKNENLWYVIEDKEMNNEEQEYIMDPNVKLTNEGWIKVIKESERDRVRALRLPAFSHPILHPGLAVSNSHIYVLGGATYSWIHGNRVEHNNNLIFYDYSTNNTWQKGPYIDFRIGEFTLLNNGSIYVPKDGRITSSSLMLEPKQHLSCSEWRQIPQIQSNERNRLDFDTEQLLAVTDTKIYWRISVEDSDCPCVVAFDLQKWQWEIFDNKSFRGHWTQCGVLYDSYLFLYGNPDYRPKKLLCVYNLKRRQWLPNPVPFFDKFPNFLPLEEHCKFLQVCDNKLAVVWDSRKQSSKCENEARIYWTKFIIHKEFSSSNNPFRSQFRAELYSHGVCDIKGFVLKKAVEQTINTPQFSAVSKLNGTNHKQWIESLMMNLSNMEIDLALRENCPPKPLPEANIIEKNYYREWKYSNRCCLKIISYHMEDSIRDSIPKIGSAKLFLKAINKKYKKVPKNEKHEILSTLHSIVYDGNSGIREYIDKVVACYDKIKRFDLIYFDEDYIIWFIMFNLPSRFDLVRSSYHAKKEEWTLEEMTIILSKEEEDMERTKEITI